MQCNVTTSQTVVIVCTCHFLNKHQELNAWHLCPLPSFWYLSFDKTLSSSFTYTDTRQMRQPHKIRLAQGRVWESRRTNDRTTEWKHQSITTLLLASIILIRDETFCFDGRFSVLALTIRGRLLHDWSAVIMENGIINGKAHSRMSDGKTESNTHNTRSKQAHAHRIYTTQSWPWQARQIVSDERSVQQRRIVHIWSAYYCNNVRCTDTTNTTQYTSIGPMVCEGWGKCVMLTHSLRQHYEYT